MTDAELQALLSDWQVRLRLQDWKLEARFGRYHDLGSGRAGTIEWNLERRGARIKVLLPEDEEPGGMEVSPEHVIVHELLHIHFRHYEPPNESVENTCFEQALNAVADAFMALKREGER